MTRLQAERRPRSKVEQASLPLQLFYADTHSKKRQQTLQQARRRLIDRLPGTWVETEFGVASCKLDKAFACEWLDTQRVLVATKCNQLLEMDVGSGAMRQIDLPPEPARSHPTVDSGWGFCGIHSVCINPSRDLLVTGGRNPTDAVVLRLSDYKPLATLTGHLDWVFGTAWVTDRHVATGGRDGAIALWDVSAVDAVAAQPGAEPAVLFKDYYSKAEMKRKVKGRVREVKYNSELDRLAALCTEGCIKVFDVEKDLRVTRTIALEHSKELVCLAQRHDLVAAGSSGHVSAADPRKRDADVAVVEAPDGYQGVRSVVLHEHLLSFGTGQGKIAFVDIRTWQPLHMGKGMVLHTDGMLTTLKEQCYLECGRGWLQQDDLYWDHFAGLDVRQACYAHAWDPTGSRLFACGGPLAFGLKGCYMGLWR